MRASKILCHSRSSSPWCSTLSNWNTTQQKIILPFTLLPHTFWKRTAHTKTFSISMIKCMIKKRRCFKWQFFEITKFFLTMEFSANLITSSIQADKFHHQHLSSMRTSDSQKMSSPLQVACDNLQFRLFESCERVSPCFWREDKEKWRSRGADRLIPNYILMKKYG